MPKSGQIGPPFRRARYCLDILIIPDLLKSLRRRLITLDPLGRGALIIPDRILHATKGQLGSIKNKFFGTGSGPKKLKNLDSS